MLRGFDQSEFTNIYATPETSTKIIADPRVRAVKFTGGTESGVRVAQACGQHMKKGTFELGGNDPFIVLEEANLEKAAQIAYKSRMNCNGQTGFAAKRFIIEECVY